MYGKFYQDLLNVVYASCYLAGAADPNDPPVAGLAKPGDAAGKLFYVLIIIIIIIIINLHNAYIHSVHSALHVTSLKKPPTTTTLSSRLFYVLNLPPRQSLPLPCQVGYFMC